MRDSMKYKDVSETVIGCAYRVYNQLPRRERAGYEKGIDYFCPPHPNPLPKERELEETPPQADGALKT